MPTAPKWAQALGYTTRNQALQFQARAMLGPDGTRAQLERRRAAIIAEGPGPKREWARLIKLQTQAEIAVVQKRGKDAADLIAKAQAAKSRLNAQLKEANKLKSPPRRGR